jgi:hypothetical protein
VRDRPFDGRLVERSCLGLHEEEPTAADVPRLDAPC